MSVIAAIASALRGEKYIHVDEESIAQKARLHHGHGRDATSGGGEPASGGTLGGARGGTRVPVTRKVG